MTRPTGLVFTLRYAVHMHADVAMAFRHQGLAIPGEVQFGWDMYKRVEAHAFVEVNAGLWDY